MIVAWWKEHAEAIVLSFVFVLALRVVLEIVALAAVSLLPEQQGQHAVYHRSAIPALDAWARWDSEYYLDIAEHGYGYRDALTGFFPLYPILIRAAAPLVGGNWVLAGVLVSTVASWIALVYLYRLAALEFDRQCARRTILYAVIFPAAVFLLAVYSEAVYLALTVSTLYYARRGHWSAAGLLAILAGLTRANSIVLVAPLAYEAWRCTKPAAGEKMPAGWSSAIKPILAIYGAPLGLLLFSGYLAWLTGDNLAYVHSQGQLPFARQSSWPWATMTTAIQHVIATIQDPFVGGVNLQDLSVATLLIITGVVSWWHLPRTYAIYTSAATLFLLSSINRDWPLQSMPRYSLTVFPVFLLLALLSRRRLWSEIILIGSAPLLGLYTALFTRWYWVF